MSKETVSRTALGAATCRLIEQYQPEQSRLFSDPLAGTLVGGTIRFMLKSAGMRRLTVQQTDAVAKGIYGIQVCRTRAIDDDARAALATGIGQVALLGAGYDTRPYRLPEMAQVKVFEVDLPAVQADKKKKLAGALGTLPSNVTFLPLDFDTQSLEAAFAGSPYNPKQPALFIWEGVSQYLSETAVRRTLDFVGHAARGSRIVFTYVLKSVLEHRSDIPDADHMLEVVAKQSPWIFGLEPAGMAETLKPFGLSLMADIGAAEHQARYLQPAGRQLDVFAGERIVTASVG